MATENGDRATTAGDLRRVMTRFPTFVTVLSADTDNGPIGCTVNAVLSLSLTPPSLLVSLRRGARTLDHVLAAGRFAVNLLPWQQRELSGRFACADPLPIPHQIRRHNSHRSRAGQTYRLQDAQSVLTMASTSYFNVYVDRSGRHGGSGGREFASHVVSRQLRRRCDLQEIRNGHHGTAASAPEHGQRQEVTATASARG